MLVLCFHLMDIIKRFSFLLIHVSGDVLDDRPRPSTIYIAQFDDNDPKFIFFKICHVQKAALVSILRSTKNVVCT